MAACRFVLVVDMDDINEREKLAAILEVEAETFGTVTRTTDTVLGDEASAGTTGEGGTPPADPPQRSYSQRSTADFIRELNHRRDKISSDELESLLDRGTTVEGEPPATKTGALRVLKEVGIDV